MKNRFKLSKQRIRVNPAFDSIDSILVLIITSLSFISRFWNLFFPDDVVFDEVHFGNFTNWYTKSQFYFDIHPPLGKLIMFLFANLSEYDGNINFRSNYKDESYVILRITPAFFSSLCPSLLYLTMRFSSFSKCASFMTAFMICFDNSMISEGKFILSDGILHFFTCLHLLTLSYLLTIQRNTEKFNLWLVISGITLGAACSCKNTAWGLCLLNGFVHAIELFYLTHSFSFIWISELIFRGSLLFICAFSVYLISFTIHFVLLPFYGQGNGYLPDHMVNQLIDIRYPDFLVWGNRVKGVPFIFKTIELTIIMHLGNMHITKFHPYQSRPIGWPLLTDIRVAFWVKNGINISCMGNPFTYYMAFIGIILLLFGMSKEKWIISLKFLIGWSVSYFPFFLIPRSLYLYHYLIPLMFGSCAYGASIDLYVPKLFKGILVILSCSCILFSFILLSPYTYGTKPWDDEITIWNKNWIYGDHVHQELSKKQQ